MTHIPSTDLETLASENLKLRTALRDMMRAADDLGMYPKEIVSARGVVTPITDRQMGFNDAVLQLGAAMDVIDEGLGIEDDHENREDPWCWVKPLAELRIARDEALEGLRRVQDLIWQNADEASCAAYSIIDRLLEGTPYHLTHSRHPKQATD